MRNAAYTLLTELPPQPLLWLITSPLGVMERRPIISNKSAMPLTSSLTQRSRWDSKTLLLVVYQRALKRWQILQVSGCCKVTFFFYKLLTGQKSGLKTHRNTVTNHWLLLSVLRLCKLCFLVGGLHGIPSSKEIMGCSFFEFPQEVVGVSPSLTFYQARTLIFRIATRLVDGFSQWLTQTQRRSLEF